jgi:capsular exopolysaccharide synthesis family protein
VSNNKKKSSNIQLIFNKAPFQFVEAYKSLRTNLQFASVNNQYKKIIITSSIPGEGKSTVAINLAVSLVDSGKKVLLIDCDLRKPMIQKYLHLSNVKSYGLTNVLTDSQKTDQCIFYLSDIGLSVIISGPIPPNPAEILGSRKMEEFLKSLETQFDFIIFDTPPVSVVTDAAVLSKFCDGVILVVKQKSTDRGSALVAKKNLEIVGANIIGCVLNDFRAEQSSKSDTYYHYKNYNYTYK